MNTSFSLTKRCGSLELVKVCAWTELPLLVTL
jgi:hypothetical protein